MAYFAWHKLAPSRRLIQCDTGCTAFCCCGLPCNSYPENPEECNNNGDYLGYPLPFPDSYCCDVDWGQFCANCDSYGDGTCPGLCYSGINLRFIYRCTPYIGQVDCNGSVISWDTYDPVIFNCSGDVFGTHAPSGGPLTTRLSVGDAPDGGTSAFYISRINPSNYLRTRFQDPSFAWERPTRYYSTPLQGSEPVNVHETAMCLRLNIPSSVPTRTMVLSGYNKYRYTGYLTADPQVTISPPKIVSDPGASGLSQMEGSLGRSFPLPDDVLTLPLWGASGSYEPSVQTCDPNPCIFDFLDYISTNITNDFCVGDDCLQVQVNNATGHYLAMVSANVTGHYHSFSGFNPYVKFWEGNFDYIAASDYEDVDSAYLNGTGLPTCSLYSLAWSLYDRSWRALIDSDVVGTTAHSSEQGILNDVASFANVRSKLNSLLSDDPRNLTGPYGESVVTYWFDQLNQAIVDFYNAYSSYATIPAHFNSPGSETEPVTQFGAFTTPKVILWDRTAFLNASTNADRWKSLYIPGSANVLFDTGCTHTGGGWKAYKFYLDEGSHDPVWGSEHAARMIQFRICDSSSDQVLANIYTSLRVSNQLGNIPGTPFCSMCATSGAPFNMNNETDCIPSWRPETWGDSTVGTDYNDGGGFGL